MGGGLVWDGWRRIGLGVKSKQMCTNVESKPCLQYGIQYGIHFSDFENSQKRKNYNVKSYLTNQIKKKIFSIKKTKIVFWFHLSGTRAWPRFLPGCLTGRRQRLLADGALLSPWCLLPRGPVLVPSSSPWLLTLRRAVVEWMYPCGDLFGVGGGGVHQSTTRGLRFSHQLRVALILNASKNQHREFPYVHGLPHGHCASTMQSLPKIKIHL